MQFLHVQFSYDLQQANKVQQNVQINEVSEVSHAAVELT